MEVNKRKVFYPNNTKEVQMILKKANEQPVSKVSWITENNQEQIERCKSDSVLVLSKLDKIVEVNEESRYMVVESGVTYEKVRNYLKDNYPSLHFPRVPLTMGKTIASTVLKDAVHNYCTLYGTLSEMISGLEVVLPDGQVVVAGSKSLGLSWFNIGPLPDLKGLFINWNGTYGVITKIALQLLPKPTQRESLLFMVKKHDLLNYVIERVLHLELADYVHVVSRDKPNFLNQDPFVAVHFSGVTEQELLFKSKKFCDLFGASKEIVVRNGLPSNIETYFDLPTMMSPEFTNEIQAILPTHKIVECMEYLKQFFVSNKILCCLDFSLVDHGHKTLLRIGWKPVEGKSEEALLKEMLGGLKNLSCIIWGNPCLAEEYVKNSLMSEIENAIDINRIMSVSQY